MTLPAALDWQTQQIRLALSAHLYHPAIVVALTLPDICAALESPTGETTGPLYKTWYANHLSQDLPDITAQDMWSLRNGVLHQGKFGNKNFLYDRVSFALPYGQRSATVGIGHLHLEGQVRHLQFDGSAYKVL